MKKRLHPFLFLFRFWGRAPQYLVENFFDKFRNKYSILFDPFGGSGFVCILGLDYNFEKIVYNDINPAFKFLFQSTITSSLRERKELENLFKLFEEEVLKNKELFLFNNKEIIYKLVYKKVEKSEELLYFQTLKDGKIKTYRDPKSLEKLEAKLTKLEEQIDKEIFDQKLCYPNGLKFLKAEKAEKVGDLFPIYTQSVLSFLLKVLERKFNRDDFLMMLVLSSLYYSTKMQMPHKSGWIINSYWIPNTFASYNPIFKMRKKFLLFIRKLYPRIRDGLNKTEIEIYNEDAKELKLKFDKPVLVFTHPPYFSSIQYFELSYLFNIFLKNDLSFYEKEIIENSRQGKDKKRYLMMLRDVLQNLIDLLPSSSKMLLLFQIKDRKKMKKVIEILESLDRAQIEERKSFRRKLLWNTNHLFPTSKVDTVISLRIL